MSCGAPKQSMDIWCYSVSIHPAQTPSGSIWSSLGEERQVPNVVDLPAKSPASVLGNGLFHGSYASLANPLHLCDFESFPSASGALCCDGASDDGLGDPATAGSDAFWSTAQLSVPCFSGGQARVFKFLGIWGPSCTSNHAKEEIYDKRQSCSRDSSSGSRGAGPGCTFAGAEQTCNLRRNRQSLWS